MGPVMAVDRDAVRAWLEASCAVQGVPVALTDASLVSQVSVLLGGRDGARRPPTGVERGTRRSQSPRGDNALRGEPMDSVDAGGDRGVVQHGTHDRVLP